MIKSIKLKNFQLFKVSEYSFDKINIIEGLNLDDVQSSSNGSGKSTLAKNAITFALYGDVNGINLKDLARIGTKETEVNVVIQKGNDEYRIIRTIPSGLKIMLNGKEVEGNTNTIKQKYIDEQFGAYDFFKKFRMIDNKGINLLDLGIISLRKELMNFVDALFLGIRVKLLNAKNERELMNIDKRYYKFYLSEKRLKILEKGFEELTNELLLANQNCLEQYKIISKINSEIQTRMNMIDFKQKEVKKLNNGFCPFLNQSCNNLKEHLTEIEHIKIEEINIIEKEVIDLETQRITEEDAHEYYRKIHDNLNSKCHRISLNISKLKEAFKFKDYRYTTKDVILYTEAIKTLDAFSAYYLEDWLSQLSVIINDLLKNVNMQVEFSADKNFIKIRNEDKELNYEQLSSGQKCFLSAVFKLAILLHRGQNDGIIIADEGLGSMDFVNFKKFIEICKTLPFQFFIVYHGIKEQIEDVNVVRIVRSQGITK